MRIQLYAILTLLLLLGSQFSLPAQGTDSDGDFCSLFYAKSNRQDLIPFKNDCFTHVTYELLDYRRLDYVGPIETHSDLFKPSPWGISIELPEITGNTELQIVSPEDPASEESIAPPGFGYVFVTKFEHREAANTYETIPHFRAESGFLRIQDYNPDPENGKLEFVAFVNCYLRQVVDGKLTGGRVNLRFSMIVRETLRSQEVENGED